MFSREEEDAEDPSKVQGDLGSQKLRFSFDTVSPQNVSASGFRIIIKQPTQVFSKIKKPNVTKT